MMRFGVRAVILLACCAASAAEPGKRLPEGSWEQKLSDGSSWTLSINGSGATWVAVMPMKGTSTLVAPACQVIEEGIAFGYVNHMSWIGESEHSNINTLIPYTFKFKIEGETLVIFDVRMFGADPRGLNSMPGTFVRQAPK